MNRLMRRRDPARSDCWLIYSGDIHVGTIAKSVGTPNAAPQWTWHCGFYPGSNPEEHRSGTAPTFEQARVLFGGAWIVFSVARIEADYQAWRDQRDWTARKYILRDRSQPVPLR
jgi:hypothetical protein